MNKREKIEYNDAHTAVGSLFDKGENLDGLSLRMIRDEMGHRGSLATISILFREVKTRMERGEDLDATELTDTDMETLRTAVSNIIERRTALVRAEMKNNTNSMIGLTRAHEADKAIQQDVLAEMEHNALALEAKNSEQHLEIEDFKKQAAHLEGMVAALNNAIAVVANLAREHASTDNPDQKQAIDIDDDTHRQISMPFFTDGSTSTPHFEGGASLPYSRGSVVAGMSIWAGVFGMNEARVITAANLAQEIDGLQG